MKPHEPNEAAGRPSLKSLYFQIILSPSSQRRSSSHPSPAAGVFTLKATLPKKKPRFLSFFSLAQKHKSKADCGRCCGFSHAPRQPGSAYSPHYLMLFRNIDSSCLSTHADVQLCPPLASTPCRKKAGGHISAEGHRLSPRQGGDRQCCRPPRQGKDKGLPGTLPMGPKSSWSSGYL